LNYRWLLILVNAKGHLDCNLKGTATKSRPINSKGYYTVSGAQEKVK